MVVGGCEWLPGGMHGCRGHAMVANGMHGNVGEAMCGCLGGHAGISGGCAWQIGGHAWSKSIL